MIRLAIFLLFLAPTAFAGEGTGVGIVLGSPNGFTSRHWLSNTESFDGAVGWSITDSKFQANLNYLWSKPDTIELGEETLDLFFGAGLGIRTKSGKGDGEVVFGPRVPVGLSMDFQDPNIELFAQVAINVGIIPSSDLFLDGNLGVRFYF
jgi:hypothetical protein